MSSKITNFEFISKQALMAKRIITFLVFVLVTTIFSCNKNNNRIPYVPVDLYLNTTLPSYSSLNIIGGWVYVSGGSKGIIVYRQTADTFTAYDRHCTYDVNANCIPADVDSTNLTITCECDGSQYQIFDGAVINGPATYPLQQYQTSYDDFTNTLHIYN